MIKKILILGGGTAGWMTAAQFAHQWAPKGIEVTVLESSAIGTIGVGEGSTPNIVDFLSAIGVTENDWMTECQATYKNGITFRNWSTIPGCESYFHPFYSEFDTETEPLFCYNTQLRRHSIAVEAHPDQFFLTSELAKRNLSPKSKDPNAPETNYSYHFSAGLLGQFLKRKAEGFGVRHIDARVDSVQLNDKGEIARLVLEGGGEVEADLFVDCSGFRSLLMQQTLKEPFVSFTDHLLNDSAVTLATPMDETEIPSETVSTALKYGWVWRIPLTSRFGNGYVYSSAHTTPDKAEHELRRHLGLDDNSDIQANHLSMRLGRLKRNWVKNCVAVGLAQGFIEPLEATAIHFIGKSIFDFMDAYEQADFTDKFRDIYNERVSNAFDRVRDYILLHYRINTRKDSDYWQDARTAGNNSDSLSQVLAHWIKGGDLVQEIQRQDIGKYYSPTSWHCMFAGVGMLPPLDRCRKPQAKEMVIDMAARKKQVKSKAKLFQNHRDSLST